MIKYIGSKRTLVPRLVDIISALRPRSVLDLFSGTSRVGHALKRAGLRVLANDHNAYAATLARCYVQADRDDLHADAARLLAELARLPGAPGYFTDTFCVRSRFFQPEVFRLHAEDGRLALRVLPTDVGDEPADACA